MSAVGADFLGDLQFGVTAEDDFRRGLKRKILHVNILPARVDRQQSSRGDFPDSDDSIFYIGV